MRIMRNSGVFLAVMLACTSAARGGLLPIDPNAYYDGTTTWSGTQAFTATAGNGALLNVTVDYAVYAPGKFSTSTTLDNPTDPSGGTQYVYAYQLWNNVGGQFNVSTFTLGLADAADSDAYKEGNKLPANIGFVPNFAGSPAGVQPSGSAFTYTSGGTAQSAVWNYSPALPAGDYSNILIYTSPYPPHTDVSSIQGGITGDQVIDGLPSPYNPVPEPASGSLLAVAGVVLMAVRVCRPRK